MVQRGDNLWTLSEGAVRAAGMDAAVVPPYWRRVVALNRPHIASGDPDLIRPGERLELPPPGSGAADAVPGGEGGRP